MTDFAHDPSPSTVLDVIIPASTDVDVREPLPRSRRRQAGPARVAAETSAILALVTGSFWVGAEAVAWVVAGGGWLVDQVVDFLAALPRFFAATAGR